MALYKISGIGCCCDSNNNVKDAFGQIELDSIGRRSRSERRERRSQRKSRRKERRNRRRFGINCKGRIATKFALTIPRKSFLLLVRLNVKKLAVKLHNAIQNPDTHQKIMEKWCKLGGNAKVLRNTIEKAYAKYKRKRGISGYELDSVGEPISTAAIIASATTILVALLPLLKKSGAEGDETSEGNEMSELTENTDSGSDSESVSGMSNKNMLLIGAGLVGAYYLLKKKK
jgi:hypothetical protein